MIDGKLEALVMSKEMLEEALESAKSYNNKRDIVYFEFWILVYESRIEDRKRELGGVWN